jgi:hypothetical protein
VTASVRHGAVLVALLALAPLLARFYAQNERLGTVPETVSAGVTAHALVHAGSVDIAPYYPQRDFPQGPLYGVRADGGHLYSIEPLASSLTFAPLFLPYRDLPAEGLRLRWRLFLTVAAQLTTVTVILLAAWLLTLVSVPRALMVTATIALATSMRTIDAAGLWQHTSAAPWLVAGLALWSRAPRRQWLYPLAGAALALATACRPILVPAALLLVWSATRDARPRANAFLTAGVVVALGALALFGNWYLHGSLLGGRASIVESIAQTHAVSAYFSFSPWNLVGLLVAPSRGLFVYSPVLLFALPGLARSLAPSAPTAERLMSVAGVVVFLLYGFIATWWGGWVFGPRYMTDLLPFIALWLARTPLPRRALPAVAVVFVATLAWSLCVQELGVRSYPCGWDARPINVDRAPDRLWSWHDTEIARCWNTLLAR